MKQPLAQGEACRSPWRRPASLCPRSRTLREPCSQGAPLRRHLCSHFAPKGQMGSAVLLVVSLETEIRVIGAQASRHKRCLWEPGGAALVHETSSHGDEAEKCSWAASGHAAPWSRGDKVTGFVQNVLSTSDPFPCCFFSLVLGFFLGVKDSNPFRRDPLAHVQPTPRCDAVTLQHFSSEGLRSKPALRCSVKADSHVPG